MTTTSRRPQRSTPPPIPQRKRDPASSKQPSPNTTMPLDTRDIIEALDDKPDDEPKPSR